MKKVLLSLMALAAISQEMSSTCKEEKKFKKGDVIINDRNGSMMILDNIIEETHPLLPIKIEVPYGYVSYVPQNEEGDRLFITETPECGIGNIDGFRLATEKEKSKLLELTKTEAHFDFNFKENKPKYIPTLGDLCIFWNAGYKNTACVAELSAINSDREEPFVSNEHTAYVCCTKLLSTTQFKNFIHEEKQG